MSRWVTVLCVAVLLCASMAAIQAADKPEKADNAEKPRKLKVYAPYHDLGLSDEQTSQVAAIQAEYAQKINQIREEERAKIHALLNDDQLAKFKAKEDEAAKKKAEYYKKVAEKRKADGKDGDDGNDKDKVDGGDASDKGGDDKK